MSKEQKALAIARNFDYIVLQLEEEEEDRLYINNQIGA